MSVLPLSMACDDDNDDDLAMIEHLLYACLFMRIFHGLFQFIPTIAHDIIFIPYFMYMGSEVPGRLITWTRSYTSRRMESEFKDRCVNCKAS